jgi:hypothetical protein
VYCPFGGSAALGAANVGDNVINPSKAAHAAAVNIALITCLPKMSG